MSLEEGKIYITRGSVYKILKIDNDLCTYKRLDSWNDTGPTQTDYVVSLGEAPINIVKLRVSNCLPLNSYKFDFDKEVWI